MKLNVILKAIEKYITFTIQQAKKKDIKPGLSLVLIDGVPFFNNLLNNLVKNLGENDFYTFFSMLMYYIYLKKGLFPYDY